ncbi:hypothetical protein HGRIS_002621 [Hohenbuehelia grisea]|uniref:N-acetyltransferase domain-containing protein n=1 Tax=Hohenbuehelia grisea TaxID=104357 RepID=A0ABR3JLY3_9AGAR
MSSSQSLSFKSFTGRLLITSPNAADDGNVAILRTRPETRKYLRFLPEVFSAEDTRARRESRSKDPNVIDLYVYTLDASQKPTLAGMTGIFHIDNDHESCEVGIVISPDVYAKSFGTEALHSVLTFAFEEKGLHRAVFQTSADNVAMRGWLEKVAEARQEGHIKECWKLGPGEWCDAVSYGILAVEWTSRVKQRLEEKMKETVQKN